MINDVREARHLVISALTEVADPRVVSDVVLVASELATNAVLHAGGGRLRVFVPSPEGVVRVEVSDTSAVLPIADDPAASRGRGLYIVAAVTSAWGAEATPTGKIVWAEIPASTSACP